jgi:hypothetical protein
MAVTPNQVLHVLDEKDKIDIERLEKKLDKALMDGFTGATFTYDASLLDCSPRAAKALVKKYQAAGWSVKLQSCQKDGSFYEFSEYKDKSKGYWDR